MELKDFHYDLPEELIAQEPIPERDMSRLLVLDKNTGEIVHRSFRDILEYLNEGDCLVMNNTRVIPARLFGVKRGSTGNMEFLLLNRKDKYVWEVMVRPGKRAKIGAEFIFGDGELSGEIIEILEGGNRLVKFNYEGIFEEVLDRFIGFPRRVSGDLFDHDRKTGKIRVFSDATSLFAWIQEKSNQPVNWARIEGAVTQEQLFIALKENVRAYEMITPVPTWPKRDDVYYTFGKLPDSDPEHKHLETFLDFFNPADVNNLTLLRALVASPLYYKVKVDRPLWVIDSDTAQGSGKTKLAEAIARLYGSDEGDEGEPFWVDVKSIINEQSADRVWRRLLSSTGRRKRIVLIDNVTGFLAAPSLATLVTQGSISGLAPYGRGEETRPNDLTYIITSNSARFDRDLIARSIFIKVNKPDKPDPHWAERLFAYIRSYRLNILSEIIDILDKGIAGEIDTKTRFRSWEMDIMAPMAGCEEMRAEAINANAELQSESDYDRENAEEVRKFFTAKIELRFGKGGSAFIPNSLAKRWFTEALPDEDRIHKNSIPQIIKNWAKAGLMPEINVGINKSIDNIRGFAWNVNYIGYGDWKGVPVYKEGAPVL